jgi:hypothetical protein
MNKDHTTVTLPKRPICDIPGCTKPAYADAKTNQGPWAYLCDSHFTVHGIKLGLGYGQEIIVKGEKEGS